MVPYKVEQVCLNDCPPTVPVVVVVPYSVELVDLTFTPLIVPEQVVVPYSVKQLYPAYADGEVARIPACLLYTSPSPRDRTRSRMPSSA